MKLISAIILSTLFFAAASFAQTPAQIDVTSLTVRKTAFSIEAVFSMSATGLPAPYQSPIRDNGSAGLRPLEYSDHARVGDVFKTSFNSGYGSGNYLNTLYLGGGSASDKYVKFTLTGVSPDIALFPTILRKKQLVIFTVPATVKGKIEIIESNTKVIAVDEDVNLKGTLQVDFVQYLLNTTSGQRRSFDFKSFTFSYAQ